MHKIHEGYNTYKKRLEDSFERGSAKEICDLSEIVKNLGKVILIDDEIETGAEHQTSQRSYRGMPFYYASGVEDGRDEVSYRRGRDSMGRYTSRRSYGDSEHITRTIESMMGSANAEQRDVLRKCLEMVDQYA